MNYLYHALNCLLTLLTGNIPKAWKDALDKAVAAGKIPKIPSTSVTPTGPVYPAGTDGTGPEVCSATEKCKLPQDLWDAPEGVFASSFDDGV